LLRSLRSLATTWDVVMKFATISTLRHTSQPALVDGDRVYTLPFADMSAVMAAGAERAAARASKDQFAIDEVKFLSPLIPKTLRDGYAFEQHVKTANKNRGREVPEEWYQFPVFYFTNPNAVFGHDDVIPYPPYTKAMDYELEIAAVIGKAGINIKPEQAEQYIFGYTIFNDWSARDVQRKEMAVGLGPAKGKDFASTLGPIIVTREALADRAVGRPGVFDLSMAARVNGVEMSRGNFKDMHWSFGEIIARASDAVQLYPGDVIGSGTVGTGCLLELTKFQGPWLRPGDVVELEIERIGILRNTIGTPNAG
jgi:fumarylacetoacetate (FAA) hydrolase